MSYKCSVCPPGKYSTNNELHMRSHLGSRTLNGHNMGPFVCQVQGCNLRAVRDDISPMHKDDPSVPPHQAQFAKDATLETNLIAFAHGCKVVPTLAPAPPAAGPAPPATDPAPTPLDRPIFDSPVPPGFFPAICPLVVHPDGSPFDRWFKEHIRPTLVEGLELLKTYEPEKALEAFGEFFLGNDIITGCVRARFHREGLFQIIDEAVKALSVMKVMPEDPKKWFANYILARSAELERD